MDIWNSYLGKLDLEKRRIVTDMLDMAKRCSPDAIEAMPYGVPGFKLCGKPLFAVAAHKEHYGVYPFSSAVIESARQLIGDHETSEGTIRFKYGSSPDEDLIKALIELRTKEIIATK